MAAPKSAMSPMYQSIDRRLAHGDVVILDGGIGSELQEVGYPENPRERPANYTWGSIAIHEAPDKLVEVHRRYAETGADVLETHTFALNRVWSALQDGRIDLPRDSWKEMALESVRLVRQGARLAGRDDVAVAFACRGSAIASARVSPGTTCRSIWSSTSSRLPICSRMPIPTVSRI